MKALRIPTLLALTFGMLLALTPAAHAYPRGYRNARSHHHNYRNYRGYRSYGNYRYVRGGYSPVNRAYANAIRANVIRVAAMRAAQAEAYRAHSALHATRVKIEREFNTSPQATAAQDDLARTSRELDAARQAVRQRLSSDLAYQAAVAAKDKSAVDRILSAAFKADVDVQAALESFQHATAKMTQLKHEFESGVTRDPQWAAARKNLDTARVKAAQSYAAGNRQLSGAARPRYYPPHYNASYPLR